jgi:hypothetical protein
MDYDPSMKKSKFHMLLDMCPGEGVKMPYRGKPALHRLQIAAHNFARRNGIRIQTRKARYYLTIVVKSEREK